MADEPRTDRAHRVDIIALCGSLRAQSHNAALLDAAARVAPHGMRIVRFERLGEFPLFNPDIESPTPPAVHDLIERLNAAHGVLIASPEYAHGVTGVMKNALDWIVGCEAVVYKPVAVLNASPRATHADAALRETLAVMSACIVERASIALPILGSGLDAAGIAAHPHFAPALTDALLALRATIDAQTPSR
ncbi:NADPH-dependent FMN reductase [Burkholderia vietnamiensis]|uniref:NADPH-dependent FMN reductase n=1 Tax=Burkholderia vietnamiensis TaxID=60552 RepID=UPI0015947F42|nr:NADPH-dependent FMN reductase [Burkholderia vietnamiensis]MBE0630330.1 NAD(P)H-dependent oxidoreductase [Burkholderia vietnamiensis]MBR8201208.1 NAD(P)H-dependent oxidoreductase [Burkholderia vietnamiensis]MCA8390480.1 NAD(P)H-dependent oxidoreductase [Burkholderia vietnamiensis]MDN8071788.1 NADPH-dependent FMN reductase [Burkholderia vietnamiensis]MEC4600304.1 NADPH-dependent FMN reductase [Burkholderia vietnamiensis]